MINKLKGILKPVWTVLETQSIITGIMLFLYMGDIAINNNSELQIPLLWQINGIIWSVLICKWMIKRHNLMDLEE